ncbi:histidine kinase dimerization/phospho-acceptor domain-containing protein [Sphingomonas flavescens]|uniref:histidine kinase dimerization/phospho-acceptor domain-containing protein n=1 Tax=Sphingomonas flavescens TaxID=3132797 RepID=UPI0028041594|nr:histidine kinase dimerization/phospho-acceptor domain-containing protein [Sphingomonas limnosediminicola]
MRYDDRLLTVLNQPADDRHDVAVRWRQLVDLVARAGGAGQHSPVVEQALAVIRADAALVEQSLRAAAARSVAAWPLPFGLLRYFASEPPVVSASVLTAAQLEPDEWSQLYDHADEQTRAFIAGMHPQVAGPLQTERSPSETAVRMTPYSPPALTDIVERIEQRRQLRAEEMAAVESPEAAPEAPSVFRWECDPAGEITWVDGAPRGALIGRSIARVSGAESDVIDQELVKAFAIKAPFREAAVKLSGAGAVSGNWKLSALPAFDHAHGRFEGYRGIARREEPRPTGREVAPLPEVLADPAALRELVHEIRTPLNAIIGFAEIIEGQYLGPADRGYRERASEIVYQARLLLTAIEDLDFAAKLHAASGQQRPATLLAAMLATEESELRSRAALRDAQVAFVGGGPRIEALVRPEMAQRLLLRLFDLLIAHSAPGERLVVNASEGTLTISRPDRLREAPSLADLPAKRVDEIFPLRLLRGLARLAGGDLIATPNAYALVFPTA